MTKIYVKRRDNTGSWSDTSQRIFLAGVQNIPALVERTSNVESALAGRALVTVSEDEAKATIAKFE